MDFCLLGPLELRSGGRLIPLGGHRERVALAMLLLTPGRVVPVERLIDAVWDDAPPATARGQIQICISNLRRRMDAAAEGAEDGVATTIVTREPGYQLDVAAEHLDVQLFEQDVAEGRALAESDPSAAAVRLRAALGRWRGPALSDVHSDLLRPSAARLDERRLAVLGECVTCELRAGRHDEVVGELTELVDNHPLRENFRALLMTALFRAGRQAEALETYRRARDLLRHELGLEPGEELQRLHQSILASDPGADARRSPARQAGTASAVAPAGEASGAGGPGGPAPPADLEVLGGPLPPAEGEAASSAPRRPHLLPSAIPDFTGRRRVLAQILENMPARDGTAAPGAAVPLTLVVGQGGAGKTTLALHAAHLVEADFPDGQLFARLRASDRPVPPGEVLERFLRSLGVSGPAVPASVEDRADMFRDLLGDRRVLVVLDDAMTEQQVLHLLPGSANCAVIVTSRRRLTTLPAAVRIEIGELPRERSMELLARIIGGDRVAREPEEADRLCGLCGDLPLPLRIVGARLAARPHWDVAELVDRLSTEPRRLDELHHGELGVRASIRVSHDAVSPDARALFRRLALLDVPSFASWVAAPLLQAEVVHAQDVLEELTEAYLVETDTTPGTGRVRYRLHDITRPFAVERLAEESPEERRATLERWLGATLALASEAHRREYGGAPVHASEATRWVLPDRTVDRLLADPVGWFELERTNIAAAVRQAAATGMSAYAWGIALSAVTLFESRAYFSDWQQTHEVALAAAARAGDSRGEAAMRYSIGSLHMFEQRFDDAADQLALALGMYEQLGDRHGAALVHRNMAHLARVRGDLDTALILGRQAVGVLQAYGDRIAEAHALHNIAQVLIMYGDHEGALRELQSARLICEQTGNRRVGAQVEYRLGELQLSRGDGEEAGRTFERVLAAVRASGDQIGECYALLGVASTLLLRGEPGEATRMLQSAQDLAEVCGEQVVGLRTRLVAAQACLDLGDLDRAAALASEAADGFASIGAELLRARALTLSGKIHSAAGDQDQAVRSWRTARTIVRGLNLAGATALASELDAHLPDAESA